jgi:hypothetical protein|tara:strand:+ start:38992 stop:39399 length:408 start_codon:yes stop_codon:yes gene_type:complete
MTVLIIDWRAENYFGRAHMIRWFLMLQLMLIPFTSLHAHGGTDPIKELDESRLQLRLLQGAFSDEKLERNKIKNLDSQVGQLEKQLLLMRQLLATDYPFVKEKMSKYSVDYMEGLDESLQRLRVTLRQTDSVIAD